MNAQMPTWFDTYVARVTEAYHMPRSTPDEAVARFGAFAAILVEFEAAFERMYADVQGHQESEPAPPPENVPPARGVVEEGILDI